MHLPLPFSRPLLGLVLLSWFPWVLPAQTLSVPGTINGSFQTDVQYLFPDSLIGAEEVPEKILSNTYLQLTYRQGNFSAGLRYEAFLNPLLGYDERYEGQGIANRFASYQTEKLELTVGNFYDQFGNGIVLRAYQEWALGIDNSIDGVRVRFRPTRGLTLKGVLGKQRNFFGRARGIVRGADMELSLNELVEKWQEKKLRLTLGGSAVSKFEPDDNVTLILPENVSSFAGRMQLNYGAFSLNGEYAYKINDPFQLNNYVYNPGQALYLNANYSVKGLGITLSAKRIDNFDFRSQREVTLQEATLSFLPPTTRIHTYRLPTLYPYATQFNGEVGFQANVFYTLPRNTKLGGKYGTTIQLNYSRIHAPDTNFVDSEFRYETTFLGDVDDLYFQDFNVEINRRWNKRLRTILTYIYLNYNKDIIEFGAPNAGFGTVNVHVGVLEAQYKLSKKVSVRTELQYMGTQQDLGSWVMGLVELSISPHWYFTLFDEYNYGNPDPERRVHYYNLSAGYVFETHRISLGYARQRRGLLCVGGICREVPASNGLSLAITSSF